MGRHSKTYKWIAALHDKTTGETITAKFCSIPALNDAWSKEIGRRLSNDLVHRISTGYRVDKQMRNGTNSFYSRWGHISLVRINEPC